MGIVAVGTAFGEQCDVRETAAAYLERIGLAHPDTPKEVLLRTLLLLELEEHGHLRPL